jgi:hypothetical protein
MRKSRCLALVISRLLPLYFLLAALATHAQAPEWQSAIRFGQGSIGRYSLGHGLRATAADASGNVYVTGYFSGEVSFGSTTLTSRGYSDIYIAKYNLASANFVWAQQAGGDGDDSPFAIAVSDAGIYITGSFDHIADFGSKRLTSAGNTDVFVAKLTDTGNFAWVQQVGGSGDEQGTAIAVRGPSVYVAGGFTSKQISLGDTTLTGTYTTGGFGDHDVFVAKLTDVGSASRFQWVQQAGGTGSDYPTALAVAGTSVYIAGRFNSNTASFGTVALRNSSFTSYASTSNDVFVAKLTDATNTGQFVWAQQAGGAGGTGDDTATALAVSGTSVYVAGRFASTAASFGATTLISAGQINYGASDVFVTKLIDAGNAGSFVWAQRAGGADSDGVNALVVNDTSLYVAGYFSGPGATFGNLTLASTGETDLFIAKLTDEGSFTWVQQAGGAKTDQATALTVSGKSVYVAGEILSATATFGSHTINANFNGGYYAFLASLDAVILSTNNPAALPGVALFPNPARATTTLLVPANFGAGKVALTLLDALERPVRRQSTVAGKPTPLYLDGLAPGLYMLKVQAGAVQSVHRLVVE